MCFLLLALNQTKEYPFILAANRDEFYRRKSAQVHYWEDKPHILGGRDLEQGGTWMAVTQTGRFAAITNYREVKNNFIALRSRGLLITDFLDSAITAKQFGQKLEKQASQYDGFNLIFGELSNDLFYYSNRNDQQSIALKPGIYVLSNHLLNTPWPKAIRGKSSFKKIISMQDDKIEPALFELLGDEKKAAESELPDTGIDKNLEYLLSSIYIESENYGTRSSSILMLDNKNNLRFTELTHNFNDGSEQNRISFSLQL